MVHKPLYRNFGIPISRVAETICPNRRDAGCRCVPFCTHSLQSAGVVSHDRSVINVVCNERSVMNRKPQLSTLILKCVGN